MAIGLFVDVVGSLIAREHADDYLVVSPQAALNSAIMRGGGVHFGRVTEEGIVAIARDPTTGLPRAILTTVADAPNEGRPPMAIMIGRPGSTPAIPLPPIAGSTEFTATVGSPRMEPRVIVAQTPPNRNTPSDGFPGGSFNYNSLIASLLKWDVESHTEASTPAAVTVVGTLNLTSPGAWACQMMFSGTSNTVQDLLNLRSTPSGGAAKIILNFGYGGVQSAVKWDWIELVTQASPAAPHAITLTSEFGSISGIYATNLWGKQLAAL